MATQFVTPEDAVIAFAKRHTELMLEYWKRNQNLEDSELQQMHESLVKTFLTKRKRLHFEFRFLVGSAPPVYQDITKRNVESVEFDTPKRAYVDFKENRVRQFRFVALKKTDGWRVDCVKCRRSENEWVDTLLGV